MLNPRAPKLREGEVLIQTMPYRFSGKQRLRLMLIPLIVFVLVSTYFVGCISVLPLLSGSTPPGYTPLLEVVQVLSFVPPGLYMAGVFTIMVSCLIVFPGYVTLTNQRLITRSWGFSSGELALDICNIVTLDKPWWWRFIAQWVYDGHPRLIIGTTAFNYARLVIPACENVHEIHALIQAHIPSEPTVPERKHLPCYFKPWHPPILLLMVTVTGLLLIPVLNKPFISFLVYPPPSVMVPIANTVSFNPTLSELIKARAYEGQAHRVTNIAVEHYKAKPFPPSVFLTAKANMDHAITHYRHALALDPQATYLLVSISNGYFYIGDIAKANEYKQRYLTLYPKQTNLFYKRITSPKAVQYP